MSEANKVILIKRIKSFGWRLGSMVGVAIIGFVSANLGLMDLPIWAVTILGLVMGEITKMLNTKQLTE